MADEKLRMAVHTLGKMIGATNEQFEKVLALMDGELLNTAALTKRALETFGTLWKNKYGETYVFNWAVDRGHIKRLLTKGITIEKLEDKMALYMLLNEPFISAHRHPFGLFISRINSLGGAGKRATSPIGCRHNPPCVDDLQHTARVSAELRG